ncbi:MAG: hypothetical protein ABI779_19720 [Acidobacteriota bacterium]
MLKITTVLVSLLLVAPFALANDEQAAKSARPAEEAEVVEGEVVKMDAGEIFALVEQVVKNPKADRAAAMIFLQKVMDGQVTMTRLEVPVTDTGSSCEAKKCRGKLCRKCDFVTGKCFCNSCCLAAAP